MISALDPRLTDGDPPISTILLVDDEANILSSLRRLFRSEGFQTLTAESGKAGLEILEKHTVDLVISDMRMPEMDGARFLEHVRSQWPETIRILLTGYADVTAIMQAINRGEIYRYLTKPWDDNDILLNVRQALTHKELEREKRRLLQITQRQNEELAQLNSTLEKKVEERTRDLQRAHSELVVSNEKLRNNFLTSIKVFSNLIEMRGARLAGHSRRVADLSMRIARKMNLPAGEVQEIFIAGMLHNLGKIGFSDELLAIPMTLMKAQDLALYRKYPVRGEQLLIPLEDLQGAAKIVHSHQERFDGGGFPDGLAGFDIPLGARILALASDFYNLQIGTFSQRSLRPDEAVAAILGKGGARYDPSVLSAFRELMNGVTPVVEDVPATLLETKYLKPGMVVARDLIANDGFLLLSAGHTLSERLIRQIIEFEESSKNSMKVYVKNEGGV